MQLHYFLQLNTLNTSNNYMLIILFLTLYIFNFFKLYLITSTCVHTELNPLQQPPTHFSVPCTRLEVGKSDANHLPCHSKRI